MTFNFEPVGISATPSEEWIDNPNPNTFGTPEWDVQQAYNLLWTYEELTAFGEDNNRCYLEWLRTEMESHHLQDIILPTLMQQMEWCGPSGQGLGDEQRPSLLLIKAPDQWLEDNSISSRPFYLFSQVFKDEAYECTVKLL